MDVIKLKIEYYKELFKLVLKSNKKSDVPVGAIVIYNNKIIGKGYNTRQSKYNVCGHAEVNAIIMAEKNIKDWRLNDCVLITTLKPCNMCNEIIKSSRISKTYYILEQDNVNYLNDSIVKLNDSNEYINNIENVFNNFFKTMR